MEKVSLLLQCLLQVGVGSLRGQGNSRGDEHCENQRVVTQIILIFLQVAFCGLSYI